MKKLLLLLFLTGLLLSNCSGPTIKGSGNTLSEDRTIDYVSKVVVDGDFEIDIQCGETNNLEVDAEDNILPLLETKVEDEKLTISTKQNITNLRAVKIKLSTHSLTELDTEGDSKINISGVNSDDFEIDSDGESEITVEGKVDDFDLKISGESKVFAKELISKSANVTMYGEGFAEVNSSKYLKAKVKGEGVIDYYGDPEEISIQASKGGAVNKK